MHSCAAAAAVFSSSSSSDTSRRLPAGAVLLRTPSLPPLPPAAAAALCRRRRCPCRRTRCSGEPAAFARGNDGDGGSDGTGGGRRPPIASSGSVARRRNRRRRRAAAAEAAPEDPDDSRAIRLSKTLRTAQTVEELLDCLHELGITDGNKQQQQQQQQQQLCSPPPPLSPFTAVVIFYNLGRIVKAHRRTGHSPRAAAAVRELFLWLEAQLCPHLDAIEPQGLANCIWALGNITQSLSRFEPPPGEAGEERSQQQQQNRGSARSLRPSVQRLWRALLRRLPAIVSTLKEQELSQVANALPALQGLGGPPPPALSPLESAAWSSLLQVLERRMTKLRSHQLAGISWATSRVAAQPGAAEPRSSLGASVAALWAALAAEAVVRRAAHRRESRRSQESEARAWALIALNTSKAAVWTIRKHSIAGPGREILDGAIASVAMGAEHVAGVLEGDRNHSHRHHPFSREIAHLMGSISQLLAAIGGLVDRVDRPERDALLTNRAALIASAEQVGRRLPLNLESAAAIKCTQVVAQARLQHQPRAVSAVLASALHCCARMGGGQLAELSKHLAACGLAYPDLLQRIEERAVDLSESAMHRSALAEGGDGGGDDDDKEEKEEGNASGPSTAPVFLTAFASIIESFADLHGFIPNELLWMAPKITNLLGRPPDATPSRIAICFALIVFERYAEAAPVSKQVRSEVLRTPPSPTDLSETTLRQLYLVDKALEGDSLRIFDPNQDATGAAEVDCSSYLGLLHSIGYLRQSARLAWLRRFGREEEDEGEIGRHVWRAISDKFPGLRPLSRDQSLESPALLSLRCDRDPSASSSSSSSSSSPSPDSDTRIVLALLRAADRVLIVQPSRADADFTMQPHLVAGELSLWAGLQRRRGWQVVLLPEDSILTADGAFRPASRSLICSRVTGALRKAGALAAGKQQKGSGQDEEEEEEEEDQLQLVMETPIACLLRAAPDRASRVKEQVLKELGARAIGRQAAILKIALARRFNRPPPPKQQQQQQQRR